MSITIANPTVHPSAVSSGAAPQRVSAPPSATMDARRESASTVARTAPPLAAAQSGESAQALRDALSEATQVLQRTAQGLEFSLDKDLGRTVVKVIDSQTREVLRQIPDTEVLHMAKAIDKMRGLLVRMVA